MLTVNRTFLFVLALSFLLIAWVPTVQPESNGKIVFVSNRDGNQDIYSMNIDESNVERLTDDPAEDHSPVWSPDGTKIVFVSDREFNTDIYIMNADGSNVVKVTDSFAEDLNPCWSPDGTKIAFNSDRNGPHQIYIMNADGSNVHQVTDDKDWNAAPTWSPDGTRIAYCCTSLSDILSMNPIVSQIRVIQVDGTSIGELSKEDDSFPIYSPDGERIVFESFRDGNFEIYVMDADGTNQRRLTDNSLIDTDPSWSPDGERIIFVSSRDGNEEIYVMDWDGKNVMRLTENSYRDYGPSWCSQEATGEPEPGKTPTPSEALPQPDDRKTSPVQVSIPPHSSVSGIEWINISYELHGTHGVSWEYWIAKHSDGEYYVDRRSAMSISGSSAAQGQPVDRNLVQQVAESLTDFYEAERSIPEPGIRLDGGVTFVVRIKLENGETISMNTWPDYGACCLIPWGITYEGKSYVQLNGRISCAIFRLIEGLGDDEELRVIYRKEVRWGCYPVVLDYEYYDRELSDDFPHSEPVITSLETLGETHVAWDTAIPGILYPSRYHEGVVYVATERYIMALNAETGETLWQVESEQRGDSVYEYAEGDLLYHEGIVYCAIPSGVYAFNALNGEKVWEYISETKDSLKVFPSTGRILLWEENSDVGGIVSLDAKSGDFLWKIAGDLSFLDMDEDTILYKIERNENGRKFYFMLAETSTGDVLWEKECSDLVGWRSDIVNWSYYDGILYVDKEERGTLVALDTRTREEKVIYTHRRFMSDYQPGNLLQYCTVFEDGIFLYFLELGEPDWPFARWKTRIVFLDRTGTEAWTYDYDYRSTGALYSISGLFYSSWQYSPIEGAKILQDTLYVWRKRGAIEAFNVHTGEKLWESEVRDSLNSFDILNENIYVASQDCRLYCLDAATGEISWELKACDRYCTVTIQDTESPYFSGSIACQCPLIMAAVEVEDGFMVTISDKIIRVSIEEVKMREPEIKKDDEEEKEPEVEKEEEKEDGFCLGTAVLLLMVISGTTGIVLRESRK